jgi:hypothetical protein
MSDSAEPIESTDAIESTDDLISQYEAILAQEQSLRLARMAIADELAQRATPRAGSRSATVAGEKRRCSVEFQDAWDQGRLWELYHLWPQYRDEYIKIEKLRVKLREWVKAQHTAGSKEYETFKATLARESPSKSKNLHSKTDECVANQVASAIPFGPPLKLLI